MKNFVQISTILFNEIEIWTKLFNISGNIESTKNPDHFLEKARARRIMW